MIVGVLIVLGAAAFFGLAFKSRSGAAPGLIDGTLAPCPDSPNCVISEPGARADQSVVSLPASSWGALPSVIANLGGAIVVQEESYIAATFRTPLMGFVDDVEFRRTGDDAESAAENEGAENVVHVRSASRVGRSDFGANRARVEAIRSALNP